MKNFYWVLLLVITSCYPSSTPEEIIVVNENDSLDAMIEFLDEIEKNHTIEDISENIIVLRKENNQLKVKLKGTEYELHIIHDSLKAVETQLNNIINSNSEYRLLPIEVPQKD